MKRTKDLLIEIMNEDAELSLYEYTDIKYSKKDMIDFAAFIFYHTRQGTIEHLGTDILITWKKLNRK